jgi:hypothetical protein
MPLSLEPGEKRPLVRAITGNPSVTVAPADTAVEHLQVLSGLAFHDLVQKTCHFNGKYT